MPACNHIRQNHKHQADKETAPLGEKTQRETYLCVAGLLFFFFPEFKGQTCANNPANTNALHHMEKKHLCSLAVRREFALQGHRPNLTQAKYTEHSLEV